MTVEIRNPVKLPTDLNPAEEKFARCWATGKSCVIGDGKLPEKAIQSGEGVNVVRGEVIRFFAYGGNEENSVSVPMVHLLGGWIAGNLTLKDVKIPYALTFGNCHFDASVAMEHTECVALSLNGSRLAQGLSVDHLTAKGDVNLSENFFSEGGVRLMSASIGGNLNCSGGKFHTSNGDALFAYRLKAQGGVYLCRGFSAEGGVSLNGNIGGDLDCVGGKFYNPGEYALNAEGSNISGGLFWRDITCTGDVNLAYAKADTLMDGPDSWKSCKVNLDGFIYDQFFDPVGAQFRIDWLDKRPDGILFSPQPYERVAKILFGMGRASDARKILLEKERKSTMHGQWEWWHRPLRWLWDICAGYGYNLLRTTFWSLAFIAIGTGIFGYADFHHRIVPAQVVVQADSDYGYAVKSYGTQPTNVVPEFFPGYAEFTPLAYSLDVFIPFFILQQESAWFPDSGDTDDVWKPSIMLVIAILALVLFAGLAEWIERRCESLRERAFAFAGMLGMIFTICCGFSNWLFYDWWWLTVWYWLEIGAGWVLTSLFLLSITGLLRPRQLSDAKD